MKRTVILLSLAIFGLAAVCYGLTRAVTLTRVVMEQHKRTMALEAMLANSKPLVVDTSTQAILAGADRVETFRLADFHEEEDLTPEEQTILSGAHTLSLDNHTVLRTGPTQGRAFASALGNALAQADSGQAVAGQKGLMPSCFDPGVAFRVWQGKAHTDICVCFYCSGVEIITEDANHKVLYQNETGLRYSRPAFLALSKQAFPQDRHLAALK